MTNDVTVRHSDIFWFLDLNDVGSDAEQLTPSCGLRALEQCSLPLDAPLVALQFSVLPHDTMARHRDSYPIGGARLSNGPCRRWTPYGAGEFATADGCSGWEKV